MGPGEGRFPGPLVLVGGAHAPPVDPPSWRLAEASGRGRKSSAVNGHAILLVLRKYLDDRSVVKMRSKVERDMWSQISTSVNDTTIATLGTSRDNRESIPFLNLVDRLFIFLRSTFPVVI